MTTEQICPIVGSTTTVLPPGHPAYDASQPGLVCPVTKASTDHHHILHPHPSAAGTRKDSMDAQECPALKGISQKDQLVDNVCPVVGPVSAYLPADHPSVDAASDDAVCPITNATKGHHEGKVAKHPKLVEGVCPVSHKDIHGKVVE
jgi:hypothetical protein